MLCTKQSLIEIIRSCCANILILEENCVKLLLGKLVELTNRFHCKSQCEVLMNRLPVMMTHVGYKLFNTKVSTDNHFWEINYLICK